jgi:soluble P-type ATPase
MGIFSLERSSVSHASDLTSKIRVYHRLSRRPFDTRIVASLDGMGYLIMSLYLREGPMLRMEIPGRGAYSVEFLVLDMNGTITTDGRISGRFKDQINLLAKRLKVYILTADTRGDAQERLGRIAAELVRIDKGEEALQKKEFVSTIGAEKTIAVGNGYNDHLMVKEAALGIAVIGREGAATETIGNADVVVTEIADALDLILKPLRYQATLRK